MKKTFRLTQIATSISLLFGSSVVIPGTALANSCTTFSPAGTCDLTEYQMTSPLNPLPTAWYFTSPTQDAAINATAKAQNIYFASGSSSRQANDIQQLLVDGANLGGYYINASKTGSAAITLANNAVVDWIEAGGALTNTRIIIDHSTLNGANAAVDYDKTNKATYSKNYARGNAIYLAPADSGNTDIDIINGSHITGRIYAGGAGTHDVTLENSAIQAGGILLYSTKNRNDVHVVNSEISTTGAVIATSNAIEITNLARTDSTNSIAIEDSQITGSVAVSSTGSNNILAVNDSAITKTNQTDGNAISLKNGATTQLTLNKAQIAGHAVLSGSDSTTATIDHSQIDGNVIANNAALIAFDITHSVLNGNIDASTGSGIVALHLTDSSVSGDVNLNGTSVKESNVWLNRSDVQGHLYGSGQNSTLHLDGFSQFNGEQFSRFSDLNIAGNLNLTGGFTDTNVGTGLSVKGETLTAPVKLTAGNVTFDKTKLIADTLSLSSGATLVMTDRSQLQTRSDQLFKRASSALLPEGYNETGERVSLKDSTLILTDNTYHLDYVKAVNQLISPTDGNSLVMLGTLLNADNVAGTASVTDASITQAVLANTQVTAGKNRLIIGAENATTADYIAVSNGFGAAQLQFEGEGKPSVEIGNGQALTLTGALGGALIHVAGSPATAVDVAVNNGTLNLGSTAVENVTAHLNGNVSVAQEGALNVVAGDHTITSGSAAAGVVSSGLVTVHHDATLHSDVEMRDAGQLVVNGSLQAGQLTASQEAEITVGDAAAAGSLVVDRMDLQGARMFIDPSWGEGGTLADASRVASGGTDINGRMTVGQNALLVLGGTTTASAEQHFAATGLKWGSDGITAALSIQAPQTLSATQGGLRVDGSLTRTATSRDATFNTAEFANRSLLMVNSQDMTQGKAALSAENGTLNVADSAALYVANAKANQTYVVAKGFTDVRIEGNGWQKNNLLLNKLLNATTQENHGEVTVSTRARAAQDVLPGIVTPHALDRLIATGENSTTATDAGQRFLSVAIDSPEASVEQVVKTVNSAAQMAFAGGVQSSTLAAGSSAVDAIFDRNSVSNAARQGVEPDASVWVQTLYGNQRSRDLSAGSMQYGHDTDFYGLMLGADKAYETAQGVMRSGAAFHAGNGNVDSRGDFNATHNDFSFWGVSLYQNWRQNSLNVTGEISLTQSSNDLYQKQPGWVNMGGTLKANVDSRLFSAGLRGEYLIETNAVDIIPHAGVRYNQLTTQSFETKNKQGENVFHTDKGTQNIWQFPVGVKMNKTFALDSGWNMTPQADIAVIAVAGDKSATNTLHTVGIQSRDVISADIMDDTSFNGQAGMKFQKGNMTFGVGYSINASRHDTGQTVSASYKLAF